MGINIDLWCYWLLLVLTTKPQHFLAHFLLSLENPWWIKGALFWFHNAFTYNGKVIEYSEN
jgi:hypothetical protein